jgi:hypothetical protein
MENEKPKEEHKYFVCSKIKALISQSSCRFNRTKASHALSEICRVCINCPKEFIKSRLLYTKDEVLKERHRSELEDVYAVQSKKSDQNKII